MSWSDLLAHLGAERIWRLVSAAFHQLWLPPGLFSQGSIENGATCSRVLIQSVVRLRHGTIGQQLQAVLDGIERLLAQHALVEQETARTRLIAFSRQAVEVELFAYVTTADYRTFLEVRHNLLSQVKGIVESSGSGFAGRLPFIHLAGER